MAEKKEEKKGVIKSLSTKWKVGLVLAGFMLILSTCHMTSSNARSHESTNTTNTSSVAQQPSNQRKYDVRLSGKNSTTLKGDYYGTVRDGKAVISFNGSDSKGGSVETVFEWNVKTGRGTWKLEYNPKNGHGQRMDGEIAVSYDETYLNFPITLFNRQGQVHDEGVIVPL